MIQHSQLRGLAAALRYENLDTDQIMPKQFLRGIDKTGLAEGLFYDLRHDSEGQVRPDFVLNQPARSGVSILVGGSNFGCGSSREHAVWGLQQFGIRAVIASSFGEIFYSNAMNNRLLLVTLDENTIERLMVDAEDTQGGQINIDLDLMTVQSANVHATFSLLHRHRQMFLEGLDVIGLTLTHQVAIDAFAQAHFAMRPWLRDIAKVARAGADRWSVA